MTVHSNIQDIEPQISLIDLVIAAVRKKRLFAFIALLGIASTVLVTLTLPKRFVATTIIVTPQQNQGGASNALAQLGAIAGLAGVSAGARTPEETYVALLKTNAIQSEIIKKFNLKERYEVDDFSAAREFLSKYATAASEKKTGFITIQVEDADAQLAAAMANAHVAELRILLSRIAVTEAQQRRIFLFQQVEKTKGELNTAENNFRKLQEQTGFSVAQALAESSVRASTELRVRIASKEVELRAMQSFGTDMHPAVRQIHSELNAMRAQLQQIEGGSPLGTHDSKDSENTAMKSYREYKTLEAAYAALVQQLELAKFDEAKDGPLLQQVDVAMPPTNPAKPRKIFVAAIGFLVSLVVGFFVAMMAGLFDQSGKLSGKIKDLKLAWSM